ncbi:GNAT family N-acetyltransferase [Caryophanon tenue]|uniref:GNAT family N-acetyltransferase n=1 Tax=Caryophanon tenue TaxID=33978 RepID=UPI0009FF67C0
MDNLTRFQIKFCGIGRATIARRGHDSTLNRVSVLPAYQGRKIGEQLMIHIKQIAKAQRYPCMLLKARC